MDVSTSLSLHALNKAQEMAETVAQSVSVGAVDPESMTTLLIAEQMAEANANVIGIQDEMAGAVIDVIA